MNNSPTQGTTEGGASAPPTKELYVKSRASGSTYRATFAPHGDRLLGDPSSIPTYASTQQARDDRDFKGGYFCVDTSVPPGDLIFRGMADLAAAPKDTNPKTVFGEAKPSLSLIPGPALIEVAMAMREGKTKYGSMNWREDPVSSTTYADAALRHLFQWLDGEDRCPKSRAFHLAHLAANAMILLDAQLQGTLIDDRPPAGTTSAAIDRNTRPIQGVAVQEPTDVG